MWTQCSFSSNFTSYVYSISQVSLPCITHCLHNLSITSHSPPFLSVSESTSDTTLDTDLYINIPDTSLANHVTTNHIAMHRSFPKMCQSRRRQCLPNELISHVNTRDGGIMRQNSANYAQHFLGLCAEFLPIMRKL